jgi:HNH endonuclease
VSKLPSGVARCSRDTIDLLVRRCIYCLKDKDEAEFNRDHVVPEAFGVFEDNLVLTCVCQKCNQFFGDGVETNLSRDSLEGYDRFDVGLRTPSEYKSLGKRSKARIEFDKDGPLRGALGYLTKSDGMRLGSTTAPCVGFARSPDSDIEWFPLNALPSKRELEAKLGFKAGDQCIITAQGEASLDTIRTALERAGFTGLEPNWTATPPFRGEVHGEVVFKLERPQFRALSKIGFNYFAAIAGPDAALMPAFNGVRQFIFKDEGPQPVEVPLRRQANPSRCHYVSVQTVGDRVVAHVSLLMRAKYYMVSLAPSRATLSISSAHFFDLDTRRIWETAPIPAQ